MSKYQSIKTEFKNGDALRKALTDLGVEFETAQSLQANDLTLKTNWRGLGSDQKVAIAIQKAAAKQAGLGSFDGLGFAWNGTGYELIQDHYDTNNQAIGAKMGQLKQRYTLHALRAEARRQGYTVREQKASDGTIRLTLVSMR